MKSIPKRGRGHSRGQKLACATVAASLLWAAALPIPARAGGGPETTLVVVNGDSALSLAVANTYVRLRKIPGTHVVRLHHLPSLETVGIDEFSTRIWGPVREYMEEHELDGQIDTIAYSADFPYRVSFKKDVKDVKLPGNRRHVGNEGSLTGLTYFARRVEAGNVGYLGVNKYFSGRVPSGPPPPRGLTEKEMDLIAKGKRSLKKGNYAGAAVALEAAAAGYPWSAAVWYELARARAAGGRDVEALAALAEAVDLGLYNSLRVRDDPHLKRLYGSGQQDSLVRRMLTVRGSFNPARGFRSSYVWTRGDEPMGPASTGTMDRYYLSVLLAHTGVRGNSLPEVRGYLRAAASSDGSFPDGTVYLMENTDVRSATREPHFRATVQALKERGRRAEIIEGVLPRRKKDVIGAVVGAWQFDWARSKSRLLPGAIAESLTSYGGYFGSSHQTKLTEFLRHGAAGSSGTVTEPYSIQAKFPVSYLHVYYADGSSLAEAFYQSIEIPYQLVVVGDPLARPFARFAEVRLDGPDPDRPWSGTVSLRPDIVPPGGRSMRHAELWIDGRHVGEAKPDKSFQWDSTTVDDGTHDVRVIAVEDSPLETRSYLRLEAVIANTGHRVDVDGVEAPVTYGDEVVLSGSAKGALQVQIRQGTRQLAAAEVIDGRWRVPVPTSPLGPGEVTLFARALFTEGAACRSHPVTVRIEPPALLAPAKKKRGGTSPGFRLVARDAAGGEHEQTVQTFQNFIRRLDKKSRKAEELRLSGEFRVDRPGFYQLSFESRGRLRGRIDGQVSFQAELTDKKGVLFVPLGLEKGWHSLDLELLPEGHVDLKAVLSGDRPGTVLGGKIIRHRR